MTTGANRSNAGWWIGVISVVCAAVVAGFFVLFPESGDAPWGDEAARQMEVQSESFIAPVQLDVPVFFREGQEGGGIYLMEGWSPPEAEFTWSSGADSRLIIWLDPELLLPAGLDDQLVLELAVLSFVGDERSRGRSMTVRPQNGVAATFTVPSTLTQISVPLNVPESASLIKIDLEHPDAQRPCDVSSSADCRQLSVRLYEAVLRRG